MAVVLPPELLGRIFKSIRADSQADLLPCIGACRAWRPLAERHLYEDVKLRNTRAARGLHETLSCKPHLGSLIRRLHLGPKLEASENSLGVKILRLCPRLYGLVVLGIQAFVSVKPVLPELNLTTFDLLKVYNWSDDDDDDDDDQVAFANGSEVIGLICCWPNIRSIRYRLGEDGFSRSHIFPDHIDSVNGSLLSNSIFLKLISFRSLPLRSLDIRNLCLPVDGYRVLLSLSLPQLEQFSTCVCHDDDGSDDAILDCIDNWAHQLKSIEVRHGDGDHHTGFLFRNGFESRAKRFLEIVNRMEHLEFFGTDLVCMDVRDIIALSSPSLRHLICYAFYHEDMHYLVDALLAEEKEESANGSRRPRRLRSLESLLICWYRWSNEEERSLQEACKKLGISMMITNMRKGCGRDAACSPRSGELRPFVFNTD